MNQNKICNPLGLIDPNNLMDDEEFLIPLDCEMFPDKEVGLYRKGNHLVCHRIYWSKLKKKWRSDQQEFPLESVLWILDRFENGFFKRPSEGGLSDFERSVSAEFNGEKIGINAMMHCCAENLPGYNVWNASRASYITNAPPQEWDVPRYMLLDEGLLDALKKIAADHAPSSG